MKRIRYSSLACLAVLVLGVAATTPALATPPINSAVLISRFFNDCGTSTLTTVDTYPGKVAFDDTWSPALCGGFANLHLWRLSVDDLSQALFANGDGFCLTASLLLTGTGEGEAGLQIAPWWNQDEGRFNVRTSDGEIACFGARLPFYSFSGPPHSVRYTKGTPIRMQIIYDPNSLTQADPGTIEYRLYYNGTFYNSGVLPFDEGNPAEDPPHGRWGILNEAKVGGHAQIFLQQGSGDPRNFRAEWSDISFWPSCDPTPTKTSTWGRLKTLYR